MKQKKHNKKTKSLRCYLKKLPLLDIVNDLYYENNTNIITTRDMRIILGVYEEKEKHGVLTNNDRISFLRAVGLYEKNRRFPIIDWEDILIKFWGKVYEKEGSIKGLWEGKP